LKAATVWLFNSCISFRYDCFGVLQDVLQNIVFDACANIETVCRNIKRDSGIV